MVSHQIKKAGRDAHRNWHVKRWYRYHLITFRIEREVPSITSLLTHWPTINKVYNQHINSRKLQKDS